VTEWPSRYLPSDAHTHTRTHTHTHTALVSSACSIYRGVIKRVVQGSIRYSSQRGLAFDSLRACLDCFLAENGEGKTHSTSVCSPPLPSALSGAGARAGSPLASSGLSVRNNTDATPRSSDELSVCLHTSSTWVAYAKGNTEGDSREAASVLLG
jgi:hypothetical protein